MVAQQPSGVTGHLLPSPIPTTLSCPRKSLKSSPTHSLGNRGTCPSLPRLKSKSEPAKVPRWVLEPGSPGTPYSQTIWSSTLAPLLGHMGWSQCFNL